MDHLNLVILAGRLVADPELAYPRGDFPVSTFVVATTKRLTRGDGSKGEEILFVEVEASRRLAEVSAQLLTKGSRVLVSGALRRPRPADAEGKRRPMIRIVARNVQILNDRAAQPAPSESEGAGSS